MAEFRCDLTLANEYDNSTTHSPRDRARVVRSIMVEAGVRQDLVRFDVIEEHGPGGGNPFCRVSGPVSEIDRFFAWFCEGMNGEPGWDDDFASEYYTDQDRAATFYDVTPDTVVSVVYADKCDSCGRAF